jgi:hypothetical protein
MREIEIGQCPFYSFTKNQSCFGIIRFLSLRNICLNNFKQTPVHENSKAVNAVTLYRNN